MNNKKNINQGLQIGTQNNQGGEVNNAGRDIIINQNTAGTSLDVQQKISFSIIKALIVGSAIIFIFELLIYRLPWTWLITQPSSYGLQLAIDALLLLLVCALFLVKARKYIIGSMLIPIFGFLLTLLKESRKP